MPEVSYIQINPHNLYLKLEKEFPNSGARL